MSLVVTAFGATTRWDGPARVRAIRNKNSRIFYTCSLIGRTKEHSGKMSYFNRTPRPAPDVISTVPPAKPVASVRSENTVDLLYIMTGETKDTYEYVKFFFPCPVASDAVVVAVDARTNEELEEPWHACFPVAKAHDSNQPPASPATAYVFALKYGSGVHKRRVRVFAVARA